MAIIRETKMVECWCEKCQYGMMEAILHDANEKKKAYAEYVGEPIKCSHCGHDNIIDDYLIVIPINYMVASKYDISKYKINQEMEHFLNSMNKVHFDDTQQGSGLAKEE